MTEEKAGTQRSEEGMTLDQYWRQVRPYLWFIICVAIGVTVATYVLTQRTARIYEASSSLEYDPNPPRPLGDEVADVQESSGSFWSTREFYETQNRIIASRLIAERVVRDLGLHQDPGFPNPTEDMAAGWQAISIEEAAVILQGRVSVVPVPETRIVQIRVRDRSPERAATIANAIADAYIEKTIEDRLGSTVSALEFLSNQLDDLRGELHESELALHQFWSDHDILSVSMEDRRNLVATELEAYSTALTTVRTHRIELRARQARIQALVEAAQVDDTGAGFEEYPAIQTLVASLRTNLAERESLSTRYGEAHPRIQEIDREIASIRGALREELDSIVEAASTELREAGEVENGLERAVDEANHAGLQLNLLEIEYARLERERENQAHLYQLVLERTTETDLTRALRTTHVRTVDRALPPTVPVSPRLAVNLGFGAGGGVVLGLLIALLIARLDRRIKTIRQAEEIGLTILGVVPEIDESVSRLMAEKGPYPQRRRRRRGDAKSDAGFTRDTIAHTQPMSSASESLRAVRTNLMFMSGDRTLRSIAVTSGSPREGKTTIATNLAISIAQSGKRVLIVDTDMRRPRLHHVFHSERRVGLTNILVSDAKLADVVYETPVPGLFALACGPIPPNPSELLHRARFQQFVREAEEAFDLVVYDSPPLGPVTDAAVLGPQLDGVLIVVKAQQTTTDALASVLRQLRDVGASVIGGVINGFDPRFSRYEAGSYYYYRREGYYATPENEAPGRTDDDDDDERPSSDAVN